MTQDIIRMAREAGFAGGGCEALFRFAALVAAAERTQYEHTLALQKASYEREIKIEVEAEREACAKVCDGIGDGNKWSDAHDCAAAIRARSNA